MLVAGTVLFNDALNTFYSWLYGIRHMIKNHSDRERGNLLSLHGLLFPFSNKVSFICIIPDRLSHTTAFVTPVVGALAEMSVRKILNLHMCIGIILPYSNRPLLDEKNATHT